jgi:ATP/maltotriose-dependent transcriptional regulator MalT
MNTAVAGSLVGRERELAQVQRFLERTATGPAALVLEGEPGIGKTTLWRAGIDAVLEQGRVVCRARPAEAERDLSFSVLGDLLAPVLDRLEALSPPRRRALQVALLLDADEQAAPDARAVGLGMLDLLRLLAEERPLVVALDDTQWLDPPSRKTLAYALRRLEHEPVALLSACRPGAEALGEPERVVVGPLSLGALHELLRNRASAMTRPTLVRIHETSGGNPFFALELARALEGRELRPGDPLPVPATLADLTASRFQRLDPEVREVLLYVAALARPTLEVVTAAVGERAGPALEAAAAAGLVETDGSRLLFAHPLLASVHYSSASPDERVRVHRRLADVVTDAEERGRHLGAAATAPDEEVAAALDAAATAARERGASGPAAELSELAAGFTPPGADETRTRRWLAAADAHFLAGDNTRALGILERLVEELPRGGLRSDALLRLAEYHDVYPVTFELAERALAEAEGDASRSAAAESLMAMQWLVWRADLVRALEHHRRGMPFAEQVGDPVRLALNIAHASHLESLTGRITPGLLERALALEQQTGPLLDYGPKFVFALRSMYLDRLDEARELLLQVASAASDQGDEPRRAYVVFHLSELENRAGNYETAALHADEAIELGRELGVDSTLAGSLYAGALAAAYRGRLQEARTLAEEGLELSSGGVFMIQNASVLGFLELSIGDVAAAAERLRPLPPLLEQMGYGDPSVNRVLPNAIDALVQLGELDEARPLVDRLEEQGRRLDSPYGLSTGDRCRGLLLAAEGDLDGAERAFAQALAHHERMPGPFERARTLLALGSARRRAWRKRAAHEALAQAAEIFEALGAPLWAEQARKEVARIGGRAVAASDELSETERQIAELVAQGRSNKEVAAALSLSPKTVEWNLSKVYAKLGVRSRTELASRRP